MYSSAIDVGKVCVGLVEEQRESHRRDHAKLGSGSLQSAQKAIEIFGHPVRVASLDLLEVAACLRVGDDHVESPAASLVRMRRLSIVGRGRSTPNPPIRPIQRPLLIK